jgi:limonene-1,2-epoxide hydrolase
MTPEETVTAFIAAIEKGDIDAALAFMAEDAEYDNVPIAKAIGHEQIRTTLAMFLGPDSPTEFKVLRQAVSGNVVMNERVDSLTINGAHVELPVAGVWEVDPASGKITLWRDYFDMAQFTQQMS